MWKQFRKIWIHNLPVTLWHTSMILRIKRVDMLIWTLYHMKIVLCFKSCAYIFIQCWDFKMVIWWNITIVICWNCKMHHMWSDSILLIYLVQGLYDTRKMRGVFQYRFILKINFGSKVYFWIIVHNMVLCIVVQRVWCSEFVLDISEYIKGTNYAHGWWCQWWLVNLLVSYHGILYIDHEKLRTYTWRIKQRGWQYFYKITDNKIDKCCRQY